MPSSNNFLALLWRERIKGEGGAHGFCPHPHPLPGPPGAGEGNYVRANIFELESFCRKSFEETLLFQLADKP
jgi:hypothetical protein